MIRQSFVLKSFCSASSSRSVPLAREFVRRSRRTRLGVARQRPVGRLAQFHKRAELGVALGPRRPQGTSRTQYRATPCDRIEQGVRRGLPTSTTNRGAKCRDQHAPLTRHTLYRFLRERRHVCVLSKLRLVTAEGETVERPRARTRHSPLITRHHRTPHARTRTSRPGRALRHETQGR